VPDFQAAALSDSVTAAKVRQYRKTPHPKL